MEKLVTLSRGERVDPQTGKFFPDNIAIKPSQVSEAAPHPRSPGWTMITMKGGKEHCVCEPLDKIVSLINNAMGE